MATDAPRRILVGCSVRCDQTLWDAYWRSLQALKAPPGAELYYAFVDDSGGQVRFPSGVAVLPAPARPPEAQYAVDAQTHRWSVATFEHLAVCKQALLNVARDGGHSHVFLVDSDVLLEPTALRSAYAVGGDIVNVVFWTAWQPGAPPQPQTWLRHPYGLEGMGMRQGEYLAALRARQCIRVAGGGAAVLISTDALRRGLRYWPRLALPEGGMWQGEDRTLAVLAQQMRIAQYADAWPSVHHAYRPEERTAEALDAAWALLSAPRQLHARAGDWISAKLTPLEDPALDAILTPERRLLRGRVGCGVLMAPELEDAALSMQPGDVRAVDVTFDEGSPYGAPCAKLVQIELLDVKPEMSA